MKRLTNILGVMFLAVVLGSGLSINAVAAPAHRTVTGTVIDESGQPIIGVGIIEKGTTNGVVTDFDGKYSISVAEGAVLEFTSIGLQAQEIVVGSQAIIDVTMADDNKLLDEVVVIGYGTVKKSDLTGSVSSVRGEDIVSKQTTTVSQALQGAVAGVLVTRDGSAPGASSSIKVRGITTMGTNDPLIIVDGAPCDNIDYVNPNDIQNISVLKDAAASSIYGSKAAAGVIVITTKRGAKEKVSIRYNGEVGWEIPTDQPDMVGVTRYMEMYNEMLYNDNNAAGFFQQYSADQVKNWLTYNQKDPNHYPITDWTGMILKKSALKHSHNIAVSGGTDNIKSKVSLSYDEVNGLYGNRKYQRYMLRANNDFTIIKDYLYATLDFNVRRGKNTTPNYSPFETMRKMPAVYAAVWDDGRIAEGKSGSNPYGLLVLGGDNYAWSTQIGGKASLEVRPVKGLSIQAVVSPFINYTKSKKFKPAAWYTLADDPEVIGGYLDSGSLWTTNSLSEGRNDSYNVTSQIIANYNVTLGKQANHHLSLMAGFENYVLKSETLTAGRDFYEFTQYPYLNVGPEDYQTNSGTGSMYTSNSVFGRVMYDYDGRYLFQANVRHDGSSRFARKYRWGTFPSASVGWVMSKERWMQDAKPYLTFLKLRASFGTLGNERIGSNYFPYLALMNFSDALFYDIDGSVISTKTAVQTGLAVEDITWETTMSTDLGLDAAFFKDRLHLGFDWYWKTTKDMLLDVNIPYIMGFGNPSSNAGTMATRGFDLELGWSDRVGDFAYSISANLSDFESKVTKMNGSDQINGNRINREGGYYNEWYGYVCEGIYQTQDEVNESAVYNASVRPGDLKYKDISGPEGVPDGKITPEYDRVPLGNSLPRFQYGGQVNLSYKGVEFNMSFQGVGKRLCYLSTPMVQPIRDNYGNVPQIIDGNYWSVFNTAEENAKAFYPRMTKTGITNNYLASNHWIFNGGYFRVKNITLAYNFPERLIAKAAMKGLRIYASVTDPFCISGYPDGWDPEMGTSSYPITTSAILGLSIKF